MIVQSAPAGRPGEVQPRLVLTMQQHTATAGELARHFGGTDGFDRLEPYDLMVDLVTEHDRGWIPIDETAPRRPGTGLPWSVYETPTAISIGTGPRSIDHNESCHPYRGLLSSMHIVGLYTGRYGIDDGRVLDVVPPESRALLEPMIAAELERQGRLTTQLEADPATAPWMGPVLRRNYQALQFFDRMALWLQISHPSERPPVIIERVPTSGLVQDEAEDDVQPADVTVTLIPLDDHTVTLDPYPFDTDPLEIIVEGRWLAPQPPGIDLATELAATPIATQPVTLTRPPAG